MKARGMGHQGKHLNGLACLVMAVLFIVSISISSAQQLPIYIHTTQPIYNEFGAKLHGAGQSNPEDRALILVLDAADGVQPPLETGEPDPLNPVLDGGRSGVGNLMSPSLGPSGRFTVSLPIPRIPAGTAFFVRAYNLSSEEQSLFYRDSHVMTISSDPLETYDAQFDVDWAVIDGVRDSDGDGIPDWWEHLNFLNATGAAASDLAANEKNTIKETYVAGLDPNDPDAFFYITAELRENEVGERVHVLKWPGASGRRYDLEYATDLTAPNPFSPVPGGLNLPGQADGNVFTNEGLPATGPVYYRAAVRLE